MSTAVMNLSAIYCKSEKGLDEMASRKYGLPPKLRSILILIDGKRPFADLAKLAASFGQPEELLTHLVEGGYVRPQGGNMPAATALVNAASRDEAGRSLQEACHHAVRFLSDQMGPMAESLCLRIEASKTLDDFIVATARAQGVLASVRGKAMAERYANEVAAKTPAF